MQYISVDYLIKLPDIFLQQHTWNTITLPFNIKRHNLLFKKSQSEMAKIYPDDNLLISHFHLKNYRKRDNI